MKLSPSKRRILNMPYDILIGHYQLIKRKQSTLSSNQRRRVENRIEYLLLKGKITQEEVDDVPEINLTKTTNNAKKHISE